MSSSEQHGIEKLVGGYTSGRLEVERNLQVVGREFIGLLEKYVHVLDQVPHLDDGDITKIIGRMITDVLLPAEINDFLQATGIAKEKTKYAWYTGNFITQLIKNSYQQGNNDFHLEVSNLPSLDCVGQELRGTGVKRFHLSINGDVGNKCAIQSRYADFEIKGNTGDECGHSSEDVNFNIRGNVGNSCGYSTKRSWYTIHGDAGTNLGRSSGNSTFFITGNAGKDFAAYSVESTFNISGKVGDNSADSVSNSTFKSSNPETCKALKKGIYVNKSSKLILLLYGQEIALN